MPSLWSLNNFTGGVTLYRDILLMMVSLLLHYFSALFVSSITIWEIKVVCYVLIFVCILYYCPSKLKDKIEI